MTISSPGSVQECTKGAFWCFPQKLMNKFFKNRVSNSFSFFDPNKLFSVFSISFLNPTLCQFLKDFRLSPSSPSPSVDLARDKRPSLPLVQETSTQENGASTQQNTARRRCQQTFVSQPEGLSVLSRFNESNSLASDCRARVSGFSGGNGFRGK